jgi:hypothetical protein
VAEPQRSDSLFKWTNLGLLVLGALLYHFLIDRPARLEASRLTDLELWRGQLEQEQAPFLHEAAKATAGISTHRANQILLPAVQVTPSIEQYATVEDTREIRLSMVLQNVGDADATVNSVSVFVEDGHPGLLAETILAQTRLKFYQRFGIQPPASLLKPVDAAIRQADHQEPTPADSDEAQLLPQASGDHKHPPHGHVADTLDALEARVMELLRQPNLPPEKIKELRKILEEIQVAKAGITCPHGRVFAIGEDSPDVEWQQVPAATQSVKRPRILRPNQEAMQSFVFLLTEYPDQFNRQWLRFRIVVEMQDEPPQEYSLMVSGIPMPCCDGDTLHSNYTPTSQPCGIQVWKADAPLMPVPTSTRVPTAVKE